MADIDETLRKAGWLEVGKGAGVWRAPGSGASGHKYTTANAALEAVRLKAKEPEPAPKPASKARTRKKADERVRDRFSLESGPLRPGPSACGTRVAPGPPGEVVTRWHPWTVRRLLNTGGFGVITYLKKLTEERDSSPPRATTLTEKAATEERDLTDTEKASLTAWSTRCAEIDGQLTEYRQQAESQRAYARLRESISTPEEPERPEGAGAADRLVG